MIAWLPSRWGGTPSAGRWSFVWRGFAFHIWHESPAWGHSEEWYDGPIHYLTLGSLLLVCWQGSMREALMEAS